MVQKISLIPFAAVNGTLSGNLLNRRGAVDLYCHDVYHATVCSVIVTDIVIVIVTVIVVFIS